MSFKRWLKAEADVADVLMNVMELRRLQIFHVGVEEIHKKAWLCMSLFDKILSHLVAINSHG